MHVQDLRLALYRRGQCFVDFFAYLVARGVCAGVTAQHISTAKKVLEYLDAKDRWPHTGELLMVYGRCALRSWRSKLSFKCNPCIRAQSLRILTRRLSLSRSYVQPNSSNDLRPLPNATDFWAWLDRAIRITKRMLQDEA